MRRDLSWFFCYTNIQKDNARLSFNSVPILTNLGCYLAFRFPYLKKFPDQGVFYDGNNVRWHCYPVAVFNRKALVWRKTERVI